MPVPPAHRLSLAAPGLLTAAATQARQIKLMTGPQGGWCHLGDIQNRMVNVDDPRIADDVFGGTLIVLILDATRRATGRALPITAMVFLVYGLTLGKQPPAMMTDPL